MHKHPLTWVVIFGVIAMMFVQLPRMAAEQDAVLTTYSALVEVDALARQNYVEPIHGNRLVDGAIRGMMRELDPYSGYFPAAELPGFERLVRGEYIGIGVEMGLSAGRLTVIAPIEGGPAESAGVQAGDRILAIDRFEIDPRVTSVVDAEKLLVGPPGTPVRLLLDRPGGDGPLEIDIVRGSVTIETVRGCGLDPLGDWDFVLDDVERIGYVRVSNFHENTVEQLDRALEKLRQAKVRKLILDLRFNPGGLLHQAVAMVDRFLEQGVIVSTVTRRSAVEQYSATGNGTCVDWNLAILVNEASASSSEIVAGSLQDHGRAVVVGTRTFGKGSVQHLIHLRGGRSAIKLTVAYYRLPNGRLLHRHPNESPTEGWGVVPDIEVELSEKEKAGLLASRRMARKPDDWGPGGEPTDSPGSSRTDALRREVDRSIMVRDGQLAAAIKALTRGS